VTRVGIKSCPGVFLLGASVLHLTKPYTR